ncbi:hypothetical protein A3L12_03420 [Thermococcus sp. P6]|nr:hypothetical protein A3L12_03420 [Thermococcus sp. P6]
MVELPVVEVPAVELPEVEMEELEPSPPRQPLATTIPRSNNTSVAVRIRFIETPPDPQRRKRVVKALS